MHTTQNNYAQWEKPRQSKRIHTILYHFYKTAKCKIVCIWGMQVSERLSVEGKKRREKLQKGKRERVTNICILLILVIISQVI